jgi:hypothetical protein
MREMVRKKKVCALTVRVWKIKWVAGNFVGLVTALEILRWLFYQKSSSIYKKKNAKSFLNYL